MTIFAGAPEFFDDEQIFAAMASSVSSPAPAPVASVAAARRGSSNAWLKQKREVDPCRGTQPSDRVTRFAHEVAEKLIAKKQAKAYAPRDPLSVPHTLDPDQVRKRDLKILRARILELQRDRNADQKEISQLWELVRNLECVIFLREREIIAYKRHLNSLTDANRRLSQRLDVLEERTSSLESDNEGLRAENIELQAENAALRTKVSTLNWERATPWLVGAFGSLVATFFLPEEVRPVSLAIGGACGTIGIMSL